jgi:hypothetical protein
MKLLLLLAAVGGLLQQAPEPPARRSVNYDESQVLPYTLPDPLVSADGRPVRDAAEWRAKRRPELLEIFSRQVYGRTPGGRPAGMHWAVTSTDRRALGEDPATRDLLGPPRVRMRPRSWCARRVGLRPSGRRR